MHEARHKARQMKMQDMKQKKGKEERRKQVLLILV